MLKIHYTIKQWNLSDLYEGKIRIKCNSQEERDYLIQKILREYHKITDWSTISGIDFKDYYPWVNSEENGELFDIIGVEPKDEGNSRVNRVIIANDFCWSGDYSHLPIINIKDL